MTRPPPNLADPAERAAYRKELMGVAKGVRRIGVALAVIGAALLIYDARFAPLPGWLPWTVIAVAFALMLAGIFARTRYHRRRMRGEG